jgi:hypothetical protein
MAYIGKSPTGTGVRSRYYYTATGGETSLSGADDNSNTLVYSDGNYVDVSLNGIALVAGTDYNTSTANTIGGLSALSASDIVEVVVYDIFTVADTVSAKDGGTFSGPVTFNGQTTFSGDVAGAVQEYFRVDLTSSQTNIADSAEATVDFNTNGAIAHDTKSKWDASNNAYEFDSNGGVYLISFGCCICSDSVGTEILQDTGAQIEVATDGSTYAGMFGAYYRPQIEVTNQGQGSVHLAGTYIYKTTTATTKIRLRTVADTHSGATYEIRVGKENMQSLSFTATNGRGTYLNVARIA